MIVKTIEYHMLPYKNIILISDLKIQELKSNLSNSVIPIKFFRFYKKPSEEYQGKIIDNTFKIQRINGYRNSFLPQIKGSFVDKQSHREIHIKMRLLLYVYFFIIILCIFMFMLYLENIIPLISQGKFEIILLIPAAMTLLIFLTLVLAFKYESEKSIDDFKKIFRAKLK